MDILQFQFRCREEGLSVTLTCKTCGNGHARNIFRLSGYESDVELDCEFEICANFVSANSAAEIVEEMRRQKRDGEWQSLFAALEGKIETYKNGPFSKNGFSK